MAKKIMKNFFKRSLLASILFGFVWAGNVQAANVQDQAPVFSGTNWIQIKQGTDFDEKDILSRVYASDYEDGDLTQKIQVVSSNVNTDVCGDYIVSYQVTDTEGNTSAMQTEVTVVDDYSGEFGQALSKKLYTKEAAEHLLATGVFRGYEHDRQHLGIYLPENTTLYVTVANAEEFFQNYTGELVVDLLADDSKVEVSKMIPKGTEEWLSISSEDQVCVPFVRTPNSEVQPILFYYIGGAEPLTYYHYGDDQEVFSEQWNANGHGFAVLDSERMTVLVPRKDIAILPGESGAEDNKMFASLDEMLKFYKDVQDQYDAFIGLSYHPEEVIDKNIRAKYFLKADANGVGAAYYNGALYIAQNSDTIRGYLGYDYWMSLHEVAHGYDGDFTQGDLEMGEMINNIFAHYYERTLDSGVWESEGNGWGYLQNMPLIESYYQQLAEQQGIYSEMDFPTRLYCFLNILNKTDAQKMMSNLHKEWRRQEGASVKEFVVEKFCEESGCNLLPYFEGIGIYVSELLKSQIYEKNLPVLTPLKGCFAKLEEAQASMLQLNGEKTNPAEMVANGVFGFVNSEELAGLNLKGTIKIQVEIDDFEKIKGGQAVLLDGETQIAAATVEAAQVTFENVPIGEYRIQFPAVQDGGYYNEYQTVKVVCGADAEYTVEYHKVEDNLLKNDTKIQLLGLSDQLIAEIVTDIESGKLIVSNKTVKPHYIFEDVYAAVKVLDGKTSEQLGHQEFIGNKEYTAAEITIDAPVGSVIEIYHKEIDIRMNVVSGATGLNYDAHTEGLTSATMTAQYVITENGLKCISWTDEECEKNRVAFFENYAELLEQTMGLETAENPVSYQKQKAELVSVINTFSKENQEKFKKSYPYLFAEETVIKDVAKIFPDVKPNAWYKQYVQYVYDNELMTGSGDLFKPDDGVSRAQFVTTLYRLAGKPAITDDSACQEFPDVQKGKYYTDPVCWAYANGITKVDNGVFNTNGKLSRQQLATFLYRFAEYLGIDVTVQGDYSDMLGEDQVAGYAQNAMKWAAGTGIISGSEKNVNGIIVYDLKPVGTATRAQLAKILERFCENNGLQK